MIKFFSAASLTDLYAPVYTNKDPEKQNNEKPADKLAANTIKAIVAAAEVNNEGLAAAAAITVAAGVATGIV